MDLYNSNGHRNTPIPLEVIYEDKTIPKPSNKGHLNPEFIGEDDDDNDIYKAQLLLFLKQSHLIRPNVYPDEQDNNSDTSDYSRKNSRRVSALSAASDKNQGDNDKPDVKIETAVSYLFTLPKTTISNYRTFQPRPWAFSARSNLDSTGNCDVMERDSPALSQTSRGQRGTRKRLGTSIAV